MNETFKSGDLVWAKMKGFPPWPGRVSDLPKDAKKTPKKNTSQWIYFFGSNNYGWIENINIKPYLKFKEALTKANKTSGFRDACAAIEEYILKGDNSLEPTVAETPEHAFDNLVKSSPIPTPKAKKQKKSDTPKAETPKAETPKAETPESDSSNTESAAAETPEIKEPEKKTPKLKVAKSSEKKIIKKKRSVSPAVNGETPAKRSKQVLNPSPKTSNETKEDPIMTLYKGITNEDRKPKTESSPLPLVHNVTKVLMDKNVAPSNFKFGFLGLGIMGSGIVSNLIETGHKVVVWNRTPDKADDFLSKGAEVAKNPAEVVYSSDITFCCVSDPSAAKELVFGENSVSNAMDSTKGYVELTTIDADTSLDIADAVRSKGGRYLEAQLQGSKSEAEDGTLVLVCAGDRSLYQDIQTCFQAFATCSFFLGDAGNAAKMNLVIQLISGVTLGALAEGMALADRAGLRQADVLEIMSYTTMHSPLVMNKAKAIIDSLFNTNMPLRHMQKDLTLSLALGDLLEHPLPLTAAANEIYKHARRLGYAMHDASAVYIRARF